MKLATTTGDFFNYGLNNEESIIAVSDAGFKYIDYNFNYDYDNKTGLLVEDWKPFAERILNLASNRNLKFVQAHSPLGRPLIRDDEYEMFIKLTKRSIETASYLGIKNIVVHSGYDAYISKAETLEKNRLFYEELLKIAEKNDITILTENFNKMSDKNCYWVDCAEDELELIEKINHPLLKACWDAGHGNLQDMPQDEAVKLLGKHLRALHIQDNLGDSDVHLLPYAGTLNFDSLMHGLLDIGYDGYFTFEATNMPFPANKKKKYVADTRCLQLPVEFRKETEALLYKIGEFILKQYNCFEE